MAEDEKQPKKKNQHFLPRVYLKSWADTNKKVLRHDGSDGKRVPYGPQCQKDYFYSREQQHAAEDAMSDYETAWGNFLRKIADESADAVPVPDDWLAPSTALDMCVHLLARNAFFDHKGAEDGFHGYMAAYSVFAMGFAPDRWAHSIESRTAPADGRVGEIKLKKELDDTAPGPPRCSLLLRDKSRALITSDNPCIAVGTHEEVFGFVVPATPDWLMAVWNPARLAPTRRAALSETAVDASNLLQWKNRSHNVYAERDGIVAPAHTLPETRGSTEVNSGAGDKPLTVHGRVWGILEVATVLTPRP